MIWQWYPISSIPSRREILSKTSLQQPCQQTSLAPRRGAGQEGIFGGQGSPAGTCLATLWMPKGCSAHPACTMLRAARTSEGIFSPPAVEGQTCSLPAKHLKKQHQPAHPAMSHSPGGAAGGSGCAAIPGAASRSLCRDQIKNTAGRSFSSAALLHSLSTPPQQDLKPQREVPLTCLCQRCIWSLAGTEPALFASTEAARNP